MLQYWGDGVESFPRSTSVPDDVLLDRKFQDLGTPTIMAEPLDVAYLDSENRFNKEPYRKAILQNKGSWDCR